MTAVKYNFIDINNTFVKGKDNHSNKNPNI